MDYMTEYILLGFLMEKDMTGYDMKQHMSFSTSHFVDASYGSIYPSLKRLEQKGLVAAKESVENRKLKKIYSINEQGKAVFLEWLNSPIEPSKSNLSSAMVKIFFFYYLPSEKVDSLIHQYICDIENYKNSLLKLKNNIGNQMNPFELSTLDFGLDYYDFIIHWYTSCFRTNQTITETLNENKKG
jgi:DNA-binding PadR family transcriptional regulator